MHIWNVSCNYLFTTGIPKDAGRSCFYTCLSVHRIGVPLSWLGAGVLPCPDREKGGVGLPPVMAKGQVPPCPDRGGGTPLSWLGANPSWLTRGWGCLVRGVGSRGVVPPVLAEGGGNPVSWLGYPLSTLSLTPRRRTFLLTTVTMFPILCYNLQQ